jgi:hypothetical protein
VAGAPDLDPLTQPSAAALGTADRAFVQASAARVVAVHANETHWWNNGSFALPLLGALACVAFGLIFGIAEATGFGLFLGSIALFMLPVVLLTWRNSATSIVLTEAGAVALHNGAVLRELRWADVHLIDRVDTLGNLRWRIHPRDGQHLAIEGEIADVPGLIEAAQRLSGYQPRGEATPG